MSDEIKDPDEAWRAQGSRAQGPCSQGPRSQGPGSQGRRAQGRLGEAFYIQKRGTVFIVEDFEGDVALGGAVVIGDFQAVVLGVDYGFRRAKPGSTIGVFIHGDHKDLLAQRLGERVELVSPRPTSDAAFGKAGRDDV